MVEEPAKLGGPVAKKAYGALPGLGLVLSAFGYEWGFQHRSLLAYEHSASWPGKTKLVQPWAGATHFYFVSPALADTGQDDELSSGRAHTVSVQPPSCQGTRMVT